MNLKYESNITQNSRNFLRKCGYTQIRDFHTKKVSFVRTLHGGAKYPRFHIYILDETSKDFSINLHLDMKAAMYEGQTAHSAEYDSELVTKEAYRITRMHRSLLAPSKGKISETPSKANFWKKLFG